MTNPEDEIDNIWFAPETTEPTDEEFEAFCAMQNGEIASELGWRFSEADNTWKRGDDESGEVPNYLFDLNLCQDFFEDLREDEEIQYANILTALLNNGIILPGVGFRPCPLIFATAWQRCQAFAILREL